MLAQLRRQRELGEASAEHLLASTLVLAPDVVQEQLGEAGAEDPRTIVLRQQRGMRRALAVSTELAAAAGACDGTLPLHRVLDAVAVLLGLDPATTRRSLLPQVGELLAAGLLEPTRP